VTGATADGSLPSDRAKPTTALLVVLSGPSGAGKDAVLDELERRGHRFHRVITCTTRLPRDNERDGIDYYFVSDAEFDRLIATGGLLEHATVYGHRSGVPRAQVEQQLAASVDAFVRTDVQGAAAIKRLKPGAVLIFIAPASLDELEARIRARGSDDDAHIALRLETARAELARQGEFDYVITNAPGRLDDTVDRLEAVLAAERLRAHED
jgi:guanylate kinase